MIIRVSMEAAETETGVQQAACPAAAGKAKPSEGHRLLIWHCFGDGSNSSLAAQMSAGYTAAKPRNNRQECIDCVLPRAAS